MPEQRLSTSLILDAAVSSDYKKAFSSASDLMADLRQSSSDLKKQLASIGKEADALEKVGKPAKELREDMKLLERQIQESTRAVEKFSESRRHFRSASIGARALKADIAEIANTAKTATLAIGAIGAGVTVALSPGEELLDFDQTLAGIAAISPEVDDSGIQMLRDDIRALSNETGIATNEIASHFLQLTRNMGIDAAGETITAALDFQLATGTSIEEITDELATAKIALGIDTPAETRELFRLLSRAHKEGVELGNLDFGDMETLRDRVGEDVFGENFQREFLQIIVSRQLDSFELADYAEVFREDLSRSIVITPQMDATEIIKAQDNLEALQRWGIRSEAGIFGAMEAFQVLDEQRQAAFRQELAPILGEETVNIISRASKAASETKRQVNAIMTSKETMQAAAQEMTDTWSGAWGRIGTISKNAFGILQEQFASAFGPSLVETAQRLFDFLSRHQDTIRNFFTGLRDGITPIVSRVYNTIRLAWPDIKQFAMEVWGELRAQWQAIAPAGRAVWDVVWGITKAVGGFFKEHPRLVATLLTGIAAWKAYQLAASGVQVVGDVVRGATSLARGHIHRLNAMILQNQRVMGGFSAASKGIGKVVSGIGRSALAAIPGISAMGGSMMAAILPALPVILPVIGAVAALGAAGYLVYRNWAPIKAFFVDNFSTIRNVLMLVFPPLGLLVGFAGVLRENWQGIQEFFATLWETVKRTFQVAFEFLQFVAFSALVALKNVWGGITGFFKTLWASVTGVFTESPLAPVFQWMVNGVKAVVSPLFGFFDDFWGNISQGAGEVIGWITGKFEWFNRVLGKWFGWLKDKNKELKEELNVTAEVISATETPTVETPAAEVLQTTQGIGNVVHDMTFAPPGEFIQQNVPATAAVEIPTQTPVEITQPEIDIAAPNVFVQQTVLPTADIEITPATDFIQQNVPAAEIPTQTPKPQIDVVLPDRETDLQPLLGGESEIPPTPPLTTSQDEIVTVGLGILGENRKQTLLFKSFSDTVEVQQLPGQTETIIATPELPTQAPVEISQPEMTFAAPDVVVPQTVTPTADIEITPATEFIQQNVPAVETRTQTPKTQTELQPFLGRDSEVAPTESIFTSSVAIPSQEALVRIGHGIFSQNRRQTLLLEKFRFPASTETIIETTQRPQASESVIDASGRFPISREMTLSAVELPNLTLPEIQTPMVQIADTPEIQTPVLETLDAPILETPEIVFEDFSVPSAPVERDVGILREEQAQVTENTNAPVTVTNNFTIVQQPGQDSEAFAEMVAEIVMQQIDEDSETYLVQ